MLGRARHLGLRADEQCAKFTKFIAWYSAFHTSSQVNAAAAGAAEAKKGAKPSATAVAAAAGADPKKAAAAVAEPSKKGGGANGAAAAAAPEPPPARVPSEKVMNLVSELVELSVVDFADLTEQLKKRLGLDHANISVPMMMPAGMVMPAGMAGGAAAAGPAAAAAPAAEEKPEEKQVFDIKLEKYEAADKIKVIKEVRSVTDLGLKEAKELVEKLPAMVKKSVTKDEAEKIINKLKAVGGTAVME